MTTATVPPAGDPGATPPPGSRSIARRSLGTFGRHYVRLSLWKRIALAVALAMAVIGAVGVVGAAVRPTPPARQEAQVTVEALQHAGARSSLTSDQQAQLESARQQLDAVRHWFYDKTAPHLWRIGLSFFVAFILGYAFRAFIRTMATLTALVIVAAGVAIYLGYLDPTELRARLTGGTGWVMDRLEGTREVVLKFLTASLSGTIGFIVGFTRR